MAIFKLETQNWIVIGWASLILLLMVLLPDSSAKTIIGVGGFAMLIVGYPVLTELAHRKGWGVKTKKSGAKRPTAIQYFTDWKNLLLIASFTWLPCIAYALLFNTMFGIAFGIGAFVFIANIAKDFVKTKGM